jgi:hypothetical protein
LGGQARQIPHGSLSKKVRGDALCVFLKYKLEVYLFKEEAAKAVLPNDIFEGTAFYPDFVHIWQYAMILVELSESVLYIFFQSCVPNREPGFIIN